MFFSIVSLNRDRVLRYQSDLSAKGSQVGRAQIDAIDEDRSIIGIMEAGEQAEQRRFATTVGADNRNGFARMNVQIDMVQRPRLLARHIREADVAELDRLAMLRNVLAASVERDF